MTQPSKTKKRIFVAILIAAQCLVLVLLLEGSLRVLSTRNERIKILSYNSASSGDYRDIHSLEDLIAGTLYGYKPFKVSTGFKLNSKSFRTKEYSVEKPPGTFRIITIGDSFTYSCGAMTPYRKHWPVVLEKTLQDSLSQAVELLNLGVAAVGTRFELRLWQLEASKLQPDLVILGFCIGNDFLDEWGARPPGSSLGERITDHSYLVRVIKNWWIYRRYQRQDEEMQEQIESLAGQSVTPTDDAATGGYEVKDFKRDRRRAGPRYSQADFPRVVAKRMSICKSTNREYFDKVFASLGAVILEFNNEVTSGGADFLLLMIPDEYQVHREVFNDGVRYDRSIAGDYDIELPQRRLAQFCEANGISYIDLLPAFRERGATERLYNVRETHWNIEGNTLAADLLATRCLGDYKRKRRAADGSE